MSKGHVNALAFKPLYNYLKSQGSSAADDVLKVANLSVDKLGSYTDEIPADLFYQAYQTAMAIEQDPLIGLHVGESIHPSNMGLLGYTALNCETIGEAFNLVQRAYVLGFGNGTVRFNVELTPDIEVTMRTELPVGVARPWMEFAAAGWLSTYHHMTNFVNKDRQIYKEIGFSFADNGHKKEYERVFNCPVFFDKEYSYIIAHGRELEQEIYTADKNSLSMFMDKLGLSKDDGSLRSQIREHIKKHLPNTPTVEDMAKHYQISASTFKRRLKAEGLRYNDICLDLKMEMARDMLLNDDLSINEISYYLGYSKPSAFFRLFKRIEGVTPKKYKAKIEQS